MNVLPAQQKIFFIGMMGTGKSYWAQRIAKKLKLTVYDLDKLVEMMEERSVTEIFEQSGEDYFRKEESKMLKLFKEKKSFVLSCGGGTPCYFDNMTWMNKQGTTIWIDEPVQVLIDRLWLERDSRPSIKRLDKDQLRDFVQTKLQDRTAFYSKAAHRVTGIHITEQNIINLIQKNA